MMLSRVDLPQPLGPSKQTNSPAATVISTGCRASTTPARPLKVLLTPSILSGIPLAGVDFVSARSLRGASLRIDVKNIGVSLFPVLSLYDVATMARPFDDSTWLSGPRL